MTEIEKQIIVGTVLGDSSIRRGKTDRYNFLTCQHGPNQEQYALHKAEMLGKGSLQTTCKNYTRITPNKKTGKIYEIVAMRICNNEKLDYFRNIFYVDNKKIISDEVLKYYTPRAMAYHFMDDGGSSRGIYILSTCGFDQASLKKLRLYLFDKYDIETNLTNDKRITIRKKSCKVFGDLIKPYIIESMLYKIVS